MPTQKTNAQIMNECTPPLWKSVLEFMGFKFAPTTPEPRYVPVTDEDKRAYVEDQKFIASVCK